MGKLYIVATPIGNLDDFSKRAIDVLNSVDLILCEDTRHSLKLLNHYNIRKKLTSYHKFNEHNKGIVIINKIIENNIDVALISDAGTPLISDPGYVIVKLAKENNIEVIGIPGCSALITALSVSGFDTSNFSFYGFFPRENKERIELINSVENTNINLHIFYESPKRIINTLEFLKENLVEFNIIVCSDLTKIHEKHYWGSIDKVLEELKNNEKSELGEYTFIVEYLNHKTKKIELSKEALLLDIIIKNKVSMKEAIKILAVEQGYNKNELYNISLNFKKTVENFLK